MTDTRIPYEDLGVRRHPLQTLCIEVAKRLFETNDLGVDAVSARIGHGDPSTLRRLFRRHTGLSPREYQWWFARRRLR